MRRRCIIAFALASVGLHGARASFAAAPPLPRYDHIVIVVEENKAYSTVIGNSAAPYINQLASEGANFTNFHAFMHNSAPNYGELFAGYHNNIPDQGIAPGVPLTTPNLGAEIRAAGLSFAGYSQSMPSVGYLGEQSGFYVRRHNPWVNWQNDANPHPNQLPSTTNLPFTYWPTNFNNLPTVSFVIPDNDNNMHDPGNATITKADTWLRNNLDSYYQWAKNNNSLLIITYDEDGHETGNPNRIPTIFAGAGIKPGSVSTSYTLHHIIRTVEDMYGTTHAAAATRADPIRGPYNSDPPTLTTTLREGQNGYTGAHDTHIRERQPTMAFGATTILSSDADTDSGVAGNQPVQALVRFDNIFGAGAGQIPNGAFIASVKLIPWSDSAAGAETRSYIYAHRMLTAWNESSTWNSLTGGVSMNDIDAAATEDFFYYPWHLDHPHFFDVTDTVQAWANGAANHGWVLDASGGDDFRFFSSEYATVGSRPALEITYFLLSQWKAATGSSWSNAANWNGGVPNGVGTFVNLANSVTSPNATLTLDGSRTVGKLSFDHTNSYIIAPGAGGTLTINNGGLSPAEIKVARGNHTIQTILTIADHTNADVATGSTLNTTSAMNVAAGKKLSKLNDGRLAAGNISLGSGSTLSVRGGLLSANSITGSGALEIHANSELRLNAGSAASKVNSLTFDGAPNAWQGKLDMRNTALVVQATAVTRQSVLDTILNQIAFGRNGGPTRWTGNGISSLTAADTRNSGIGAILNDNGAGGVLYPTFFGQAVDINSILIRRTWAGDIDLDGIIDADDYARIDAGFANRRTGYINGDLDYSGQVDADDYFLIDYAFSTQTGGLSPLSFAASSVPEASAVSLGLGVSSLLALRPRSRRAAGDH